METMNIDQNAIFNEMKQTAQNMSGWVKFYGIMSIVGGGIAALTIIGIVFAWLPIWMGVILVQAANRATSANMTNNPKELVYMLDRFRLYFVINGIVILIALAGVILSLIIFGVSIPYIFDLIQNEMAL
jgi:hypothetical protein